MRTFSIIPALLCLSAPALAQTAAVDFTPPAQVKLFKSIQFINGVGKTDGDSCDEAFHAALEDGQRVADKREHGVIVAVFDNKPEAPWTVPATLPCSQKGNPPKKSVVKAEALALQLGDTDAYPTISGQRAIEIADSLVVEGAFMGAQLNNITLEDWKGEIYYWSRAEPREETFDRDDSRNTRGVTVFRESITPRIAGLVETIAEVPEVHGLHLSAYAKRWEKTKEGMVEQGETFHLYIPTSVALGFVNGDYSEQELIDRGSVMHDDGGIPTKTDISFVDAED